MAANKGQQQQQPGCLAIIVGVLILGAILSALGFGDDEDDYRPSQTETYTGGGFPDESDDEIIEGCLRGGSDYETCKNLVLPLVRASDHDGDGIENRYDADYRRENP